MQFELVDNNGGNPVIYDSILLSPDKMNIFSSELSLKIIEELVKEPACAMDLARRLDQHEQKIYYHLRRLEGAGVVKHIRSEKRYSMTAKIYGVVSPVVSARLFEGGQKIGKSPPKMDSLTRNLFLPFINNGKLDAKVIAGDPYPHGKYDKAARDPVRALDMMVMLGNLAEEVQYPVHQLDVDTNSEHLKENLILFGNSRTNTIVDKLTDSMPVKFDPDKGFHIVSTKTGKTYDDARTGIVVKIDNPWAPGKKILIVGGIRSRGAQAATIAITQHAKKIAKRMDESGNLAVVVEGFDSSGNKVIDSIKIIE